jgi:hypothetical protein
MANLSNRQILEFYDGLTPNQKEEIFETLQEFYLKLEEKTHQFNSVEAIKIKSVFKIRFGIFGEAYAQDLNNSQITELYDSKDAEERNLCLYGGFYSKMDRGYCKHPILAGGLYQENYKLTCEAVKRANPKKSINCNSSQFNICNPILLSPYTGVTSNAGAINSYKTTTTCFKAEKLSPTEALDDNFSPKIQNLIKSFLIDAIEMCTCYSTSRINEKYSAAMQKDNTCISLMAQVSKFLEVNEKSCTGGYFSLLGDLKSYYKSYKRSIDKYLQNIVDTNIKKDASKFEDQRAELQKNLAPFCPFTNGCIKDPINSLFTIVYAKNKETCSVNIIDKSCYLVDNTKAKIDDTSSIDIKDNACQFDYKCDYLKPDKICTYSYSEQIQLAKSQTVFECQVVGLKCIVTEKEKPVLPFNQNVIKESEYQLNILTKKCIYQEQLFRGVYENKLYSALDNCSSIPSKKENKNDLDKTTKKEEEEKEEEEKGTLENSDNKENQTQPYTSPQQDQSSQPEIWAPFQGGVIEEGVN